MGDRLTQVHLEGRPLNLRACVLEVCYIFRCCLVCNRSLLITKHLLIDRSKVIVFSSHVET